MANDTKTLSDDNDQLRKIIEQRDAEIEILLEQISHRYNKLFGKKTEKGGVPSQGEQLPLFDMPEPDPEAEAEAEEDSDNSTHVEGHERKKKGRKKLPDSLPRVKVIHDIPEEDKLCGCGNLLNQIGVEMRKEQSEPILDTFHEWLLKKHEHVTPKSLLGKAVTYCINQWACLAEYVKHGEVTPDNNLAENAIRPFVIGRKNWLFAGSPKGAHASSTLYSLVETAKANTLAPYKYLRFVFEKLPFAEVQEDYKQLLPMNLTNADLGIEGISGV